MYGCVKILDRIRHTQITHVVYIEKPMNLASLKFSGRFLVLTAYSVHMTTKKKSQARGAVIPRGVVSHSSTTCSSTTPSK